MHLFSFHYSCLQVVEVVCRTEWAMILPFHEHLNGLNILPVLYGDEVKTLQSFYKKKKWEGGKRDRLSCLYLGLYGVVRD